MAYREKETVKVLAQECLADGIFSMWMETEAAKTARPGQFISMYTGNDTNAFHIICKILWRNAVFPNFQNLIYGQPHSCYRLYHVILSFLTHIFPLKQIPSATVPRHST